MDTGLTDTTVDPLAAGGLACAGGAPTPPAPRVGDDRLQREAGLPAPPRGALPGSWLPRPAAAGAAGLAGAPLVRDAAGRQLVGEGGAVLDSYRPGRRRRRGVPPAAPAVHLPLEREAALVWRVRRVAQDCGL